MELNFQKYHGAGNDFIIIDDRDECFKPRVKDTKQFIAHVCRRSFGIGADGLMLLKRSRKADFGMTYYNSDGLEAGLCGNGGRCITAFAASIGLIRERTIFEAADGLHEAMINFHEADTWDISLRMNDLHNIGGGENEFILDTGSPHLVIFSEDIEDKDVFSEGRSIRYSPNFAARGINVNFAEALDHSTILVRTYERGVEAETQSCGTGATAVALAAWKAGFRNPSNQYTIKAPGGNLRVGFTPPNSNEQPFTQIWLSGPAEKVFSGIINIK